MSLSVLHASMYFMLAYIKCKRWRIIIPLALRVMIIHNVALL
jgi:hypothetical protein